MLSVGSLFSGIGGFDLGFERAGMRVVFQCEIDAWCRGILAQHWPEVPCYEDVRLVRRAARPPQGGRDRNQSDRDNGGSPYGSADVLCGGFPCQDLSVAGRRAGLDGERSGLFFEFARIADELVRPGGWIVVENVPGLLSSQGGRDFAVVLRTLGDFGFHDLAWRVLDSRYFGVPQRRRRVFVVGRRAAGDGARQVLLEPESGGGDFAPSREAGARVAASLSRGSNSPGVSAPGRRQEDDENIVGALMEASHGGGWRVGADEAAANHIVTAPALVKRYAKGTDSDATDTLIAHTLRAEGFDASEDGTGRGTPLIANPLKQSDGGGRGWGTGPEGNFVCAATDADRMRTSPGLPRRVDDPQPDGPRYAAMGNAVTVPVAEWIGCRIVAYEEGRLAA